MWSCPGNMPKYYPGLRDILPDRRVILTYYLDKTTVTSLLCLIVQVICQNITVPNITTETYTKYNNIIYTFDNTHSIKIIIKNSITYMNKRNYNMSSPRVFMGFVLLDF